MRDQFIESSDSFRIKLRRVLETEEIRTFTERAPAGEQLERLWRQVRVQTNPGQQRLGDYRGFQLLANKQRDRDEAFFTPVVGWFAVPEGKLLYEFKFSDTATGTIQSIDAQLRSLDTHLHRALQAQRELHHKQEQLTAELGKGWEYAPTYEALQQQLQVVNQALAADGSEVGELQMFTPLDADALRVCEPAPVRQLAASASQSSLAVPSFAIPDDSESDISPTELLILSPQQEPARITLEELREQARPSPARKSSRASSTAQMSLW